MKIDRRRLLTHLERIHCGGAISRVDFAGPFEGVGRKRPLTVLAPRLSATEPLPGAVGVTDLKRMIVSLRLGTSEEVSIDVEPTKLVINVVLSTPNAPPPKPLVGTAPIRTSSPRWIGTEEVNGLRSWVAEEQPDAEVVSIGEDITRSATKLARFFGQEIEVFVGPDSVWARFGDEAGSHAVLSLKGEEREEPFYALNFGAEFVKVLETITDYTMTTLTLHGPRDFAVVQDGDGYTYLLWPRIA